MGKHMMYQTNRPERQRDAPIHPIWRGVGLALIVLTPFLGYVGALVLLQENTKRHWFPLPVDLLVRSFSDPLILIKLILTVVIAFILYALFSFVVFGLQALIGEPRYGPYDAPAPKLKGRGTRKSR